MRSLTNSIKAVTALLFSLSVQAAWAQGDIPAAVAATPPVREAVSLTAQGNLALTPGTVLAVRSIEPLAGAHWRMESPSVDAIRVQTGTDSTTVGARWMLQRAADGANISVDFSPMPIAVSAVAVGAALTVAVIPAGMALMAGSVVVARIPHELSAHILRAEPVTQDCIN